MATSGEKGLLLVEKNRRSSSPDIRPSSPSDIKLPTRGRRHTRASARTQLLSRLSEDPQSEPCPNTKPLEVVITPVPDPVPTTAPPPPSAPSSLAPVTTQPPPTTQSPPPPDDGCPDYFGVRSYLHHFYEQVSVKDPSLYEQPRDSEDEDDHFRFLVGDGDESGDGGRRGGLCWRLCVWGGANLMILGAIAVLIGCIVPRRPVLVGIVTPELEVVDRTAVRFNAALDACTLSGLGLFGAGGALLALALLASSILRTKGRRRPHRPPQFPWGHHHQQHVPLQTNIPATESFATIQPPQQSTEEARLIKAEAPHSVP